MSLSAVRFTSFASKYKIRIKQFNALDSHLKNLPGCDLHILAGDMNFHKETENTVYLSKDYQDCWLSSNPDSPGYTFDSHNNKLIHVMFGGMEDRRMRLDRILLYDKKQILKIREMNIIGTKPIYPNRVYRNHFGLYALSLLLRGAIYDSERIYSRYLHNSDHYGLSTTFA